MKKLFIFILVVIIIILGVFMYLRTPADNSGPEVKDVEVEVVEIEDSKVYQVNQDRSEVRFEIDEILRGEDFRVVGKTNQVQAQVAISDSSLGISRVVVDARNLETDSASRDGAIRRFILNSDQEENRFITLENVEVSNLPTDFEAPASFIITGDLNISGITKRIELDADIKELNDEEIILGIEGDILRSDFGLSIPEVPFVASVSQTVGIYADLVFEQYFPIQE